MHWKPHGYPSVSPYLIVADAEHTLAFAQQVFGATRLRLHRRADGGIKHAETRIGDSVIMIGEMPNAPAAHLHVYVPDGDATFAAALGAGAQVVQDMADAGDGDYRGGVADKNGTIWWIAQDRPSPE
jgi:PhnB protein